MTTLCDYTLKDSVRLYEAALDEASRQCGRSVNREDLIVHTINHPSQVFKVNDQLKAMVIEVDIERGRVVLEPLQNSA